jgi:hypothetical protein
METTQDSNLATEPESHSVDQPVRQYPERIEKTWRADAAEERESKLLVEIERLRDGLEHIKEYWNRDENETAMADALWHIIETADNLLSNHRGQRRLLEGRLKMKTKTSKQSGMRKVNGGSRSVDHIVRHLPSEEGFYWWRENPERTWRMVQVVDFASSVEDKAHLMTYDVQNHSWSGRSLKGWAEYFPIGEWLHVRLPNAVITDGSERSGETFGG